MCIHTNDIDLLSENKVNKNNILGLVFVYVGLINFFNIAIIPNVISSSIRVLISLFLLFHLFKYAIKNHKKYGRLINIFYCFIIFQLISLIYASFIHSGLNVIDNFLVHTRCSIGFLAIFYLLENRFTIREIIIASIILAFLFCIVFVISFFDYNFIRDFEDNAGAGVYINNGFELFRLKQRGIGFVALTLFISIVNFTKYKKNSWIILSVLMLAFIIMYQTRQLVVYCVGISIFYYLWKSKIVNKIKAILILLISIILMANTFIGNVVDGLILKTVDQTSSGQNTMDARWLDYEYFFTEYNSTALPILIGNGTCAIRNNSKYAESCYDAGYRKGWILTIADAGYAYIFVQWGILGLLIWIILFYNIFRWKIPDEFVWAKLMIIMLMFLTVGTYSIFNQSYSTCVAICIYVLSLCQNEKLRYIKNNNK